MAKKEFKTTGLRIPDQRYVAGCHCTLCIKQQYIENGKLNKK